MSKSRNFTGFLKSLVVNTKNARNLTGTRKTEVYLGPWQTSMKELFAKQLGLFCMKICFLIENEIKVF